MHTMLLRRWPLFIILLLLFIPLRGAFPQAARDDIPTENIIFLPFIMGNDVEPGITDAWIGNTDGLPLRTFLPGAPFKYIVVGENPYSLPITVDLRWTQTGPCDAGEVFTKTLELNPGLWVDAEPAAAPNCLGDYQATVQVTDGTFTSTQSVDFHVDTASVALSDKHGFDRCNMPSVADMQTWWDSSPYYVANIYLGGISYDNSAGCSNDNIDIDWMQSVADQGWAFLLAWVGPQSPCSGYKYRMSYDSTISYQEGRAEADLAIQAAAGIGLPSSIVVYYDIEGYGNAYNWTCREVVDSFVLGWTERLHELGANAGVYGSPCNSHIIDWADNDPPPDDIWAAHWIYQSYNPFASVWDLACLSNDYWTDHQRARQYAGDHTEYWGGLPLGIDSNVLDGEVVVLGSTDPVSVALDAPALQATPQLRDLGLLSPDHGWVLLDDRLLVSADGGIHWDDLTPQGTTGILDVQFIDPSRGLLVQQGDDGLGLLSTFDGGRSWQPVPRPLPIGEIAAASLAFEDLDKGTLSLKQLTGGSFNISQEFIMLNGGQTWQGGEIRSKPVDEGRSRPLSAAENLPDGTVLVDWYDSQHAWALVQAGTCQGTKVPIGQAVPPDALPFQCTLQTRLWRTTDGGQTWQEIEWHALVTEVTR